MKAVDLFAGAGGTTTGVKQTGKVDMVWAANHNPKAVAYHALNHPEVSHTCQDLHQADWSLVPKHNLLFASPCCAGHSRASGQKKKTKQADLSRSTAWAVVSCLESHRTDIGVIENVTDFLDWELYPAWEHALKSLGYSISINYVNASEMGIPQNRERIFIVVTRSKNPIELNIEKEPMIPARTIIDLSEDGYEWDLVKNRVPATRLRVENGRKQFGHIFLDAAYGSAKTGRSLDKPLGAITTVNKHSLVIGDKIRPLSIDEIAAAQTFDPHYVWPKSKVLTKMMIGNAVPPLMAEKITRAVLKAA
ncbi:DNA cytosine methyltransferase [Vibrio crassostreae]|uniref:DNA cytosine methyltransferase n=1 Tax=Vibrio crassostreae TaxID=246167 RepID=UPI001B30EC60|nr:DNA cytosine methyltransferase [Vibrio crassostreae]